MIRLRSGHPIAAKCAAFTVHIGAGKFYHWIRGYGGTYAQAVDGSGNAYSEQQMGKHGPYWVGYRLGATNTDACSQLTGAASLGGKPFSAFAAIYSRQFGPDSCNEHEFFRYGGSVPDFFGFGMDVDGATLHRYEFRMFSPYVESSITYTDDASSVPDGTPRYFGASYGSAGLKAYMNGEDVTSSSTVVDDLATGFVPMAIQNDDTTLAVNRSGSAYSYMANHLCAYLFDAELSHSDFQFLTSNPLGLLENQKLYVPMIGEVTVTETPAGTTVIITSAGTAGTWTDGDQNINISGSGFV